MKSIVTGMSLDDGRRMYGYGDYMAILFTVMLVELAVHKAFVSCEHHIVSGYQNIGLRCPEDAAIGDPGAKKPLTFKVRWGKFPSLLHSFRCSLPKWFC